MDPAAILERFLDRPRVAFVREILDTYGTAAGGLLANGLAFAALFATIPTALVTLGLAGLLVADPDAQAQLAESLKEAVPPLADLIDGALSALQEGAAVSSIVGVVSLVWTVSRLYVALDVAFSRIFHAAPQRDALRRTARGFAWVVALIGIVIGAIVLGTLAATADALLPDGFALGALVVSLTTSLPVLMAIVVAMVVLMYRLLPPRTPAWGTLALPAVVAAVAIAALSQAFLFLAPRLVGGASLAGPLATVFVALAWLSLTFQALLYGAAWVRVRDVRARGLRSALARPAAPAEPGGRGE